MAGWSFSPAPAPISAHAAAPVCAFSALSAPPPISPPSFAASGFSFSFTAHNWAVADNLHTFSVTTNTSGAAATTRFSATTDFRPTFATATTKALATTAPTVTAPPLVASASAASTASTAAAAAAAAADSAPAPKAYSIDVASVPAARLPGVREALFRVEAGRKDEWKGTGRWYWQNTSGCWEAYSLAHHLALEAACVATVATTVISVQSPPPAAPPRPLPRPSRPPVPVFARMEPPAGPGTWFIQSLGPHHRANAPSALDTSSIGGVPHALPPSFSSASAPSAPPPPPPLPPLPSCYRLPPLPPLPSCWRLPDLQVHECSVAIVGTPYALVVNRATRIGTQHNTTTGGQRACRFIEAVLESELPGDIAMSLPRQWSRPLLRDATTLRPLDERSDEYRSLACVFHATCPDVPVRRIEAIQAAHLYLPYAACRASRLAGVEHVMFHGTTRKMLAGICDAGFDRARAGLNGVAYGIGAYFARDASYALRFCDAADNLTPGSASSDRSMLVAFVLVGKVAQRAAHEMKELRAPPMGHQATGDLHGRLVCIFKDYHAYPAYIITF